MSKRQQWMQRHGQTGSFMHLIFFVSFFLFCFPFLSSLPLPLSFSSLPLASPLYPWNSSPRVLFTGRALQDGGFMSWTTKCAPCQQLNIMEYMPGTESLAAAKTLRRLRSSQLALIPVNCWTLCRVKSEVLQWFDLCISACHQSIPEWIAIFGLWDIVMQLLMWINRIRKGLFSWL